MKENIEKAMFESSEEFDVFEQKLDVMHRTDDKWLKDSVGNANVDALSLQVVKKDLEVFEKGLEELTTDLNEEEYAKLQSAKDRSEAILLVNSKKTFGDSKEMRQVKTDVTAVERYITAENAHGLTVENLDEAQQLYMKAISSCETYLGTKSPSTDSGKARFMLVEKNRNRLLREVQQIAVARELMASGRYTGVVRVISDLFFVQNIYELTPAKTETVSAQKEKTASATNPKMLKALSAFKVNREKIKKDKERQEYTDEISTLYRDLSALPKNKAVSMVIQMQGEWVLFAKDEQDAITITVDGASMTLKEDLQDLLYDLQVKMIEENDRMYPDDIENIIWAQGQTIETGSTAEGSIYEGDAGAMQKSRNILTRYIELKTKKPAAFFANYSIALLKVMASDLFHGRDIDKLLEMRDADRLNLYVNTMETRELLRQSQKRDDVVREKIEYTPAHQGIELNGWTEDEAKIRDFISDLIFPEETWKSDETMAKPEERVRYVVCKHSDTLALIIADSYRENQDQPSILDQILDKLPLQAVDQDAEELRNILHECIDEIKDGVELGIDTAIEGRDLLKESFPDNMPEWLKDSTEKELRAQAEEKKRDKKEIAETIRYIYSEPQIIAGIKIDMAKLSSYDSKIDSMITQQSANIQAHINANVGQVFQQGEVQETSNDAIIAKAQQIGDFANVSEFLSRAKRVIEEERRADPQARITTDPQRLANDLRKTARRDGEDYLNRIIADSMRGGTGQGLFIKNVFSEYFTGVSPMDKRNMFASAIKNSVPRQEGQDERKVAAQYLAGMLKGAGPLFQKLMQGLPEEGFPEEIQTALKDMKSKLAPIPEEIVKAQLLGMVERSHGNISKITVTRALGAASVGQTFLCKMFGKDLPEEGKDVVIKLLKPDVRNRMQREKQVMLQAARHTDAGMEATYLGQLSRIEEELDLNIEARNVIRGEMYDKSLIPGLETDGVKAMKLNTMIKPTTNAMALEMAPGETVDRYMTNLKARISAMRADIPRHEDEISPEGADRVEVRKMEMKYLDRLQKMQDDLMVEVGRLATRHYYMQNLSNKWATEGIFGEGFYHGDLHAGNIMIDDNGATIIDFGNATTLDAKQQKEVTRMVAAAAVGDAGGFQDGLHALLKPEFENLYKQKKNELSRVLKAVFTLGDQNSAGQRVAVALLKAQEMGLEVPSAIFNFSQCELRLQNAVDSMKSTMEEIHEVLRENIREAYVLSSSDLDQYNVFRGCFNIDVPTAKNAVEALGSIQGSIKHQKKLDVPIEDEEIIKMMEEDKEDKQFSEDIKAFSRVSNVMNDIAKIVDPYYLQLINGRQIDVDKLYQWLINTYITGTADGTDVFEYVEHGTKNPENSYKMIDDLGVIGQSFSFPMEIKALFMDYNKKLSAQDLTGEAREQLADEFTKKYAYLKTRFDDVIQTAKTLKDNYEGFDKLKGEQKDAAQAQIIGSYKKLHRIRQVSRNNGNTFAEKMMKPEKDRSIYEITNMKAEVDHIKEYDKERGDAIQDMWNKIIEIKETPGYDKKVLRDKCTEMFEVLTQLSEEKVKELGDSLEGYRELHEIITFAEIMGISINEHIDKALERLGFLTSVRYRSKMKEAERNKVQDD